MTPQNPASGPDPSPRDPSSRILVERSALRALRESVRSERLARDEVQKQLNRETEFSRRAAEETLAAREERDRFRRLLAASVANEQNAVGALSSERERAANLERELREAERLRGIAEGRSQELDARLTRIGELHAHDMEALQHQLRRQADEHGLESTRLSRERGIAEGRAEELATQIPPPADATSEVARGRAWLAVGIGAICTLIGLVILPALLVVLFSGQRAEYLRLAVGLPPGVLLILEAALLSGAYVMTTRGLAQLSELRRSGKRETL